MKTFRIAVTGGRDHELTGEEAARLNHTMSRLMLEDPERRVILIHGNCRGVDQDAALLAESWGFPVVPFEAPWNFGVCGPDAGRGEAQSLSRRLGPVAGPLRNWMMLQAADLLVAFPGGRGPANAVRQARDLGVEVVEVGRGD